MSIFSNFIQAFKIRDLRKSIIFIILLLVVYRVAATVPIPGVDLVRLKEFFASNQLFNLIALFTAGGADGLSLAMLGVGPYITASIIMQLLTMIFPAIERLYKEEGEIGRQKFNQYSRLLSVPLAFLQGYGTMLLFINRQILPQLDTVSFIAALLTVTAGSVFVMWLGELISEKGLGNGISLLIFAGIVARLPISFQRTISVFDQTQLFSLISFGIISLFIIAAVGFITEAQRNIPVAYAKRVRGFKMYGGVSTHLPLRVNQAGVIPIIFALSILLFPSMIANFLALSKFKGVADLANSFNNFLQNQIIFNSFYFILVVLFTYFYTAITFDPKNIADNLQKQGGFIPGTRPGLATSQYLSHILNRVTLFGALFLGFVAVVPNIVSGVTGILTLTIGGTALLIVVSVVLETMKQFEAQLVMRDYEKL